MCSALSIEAFSVFVGCHAGGVAERSVEGAGVGESCLSSDEGDGPGKGIFVVGAGRTGCALRGDIP